MSLKELGIRGAIGAGLGGAAGAGYGLWEDENQVGRRALQGAGVGGVAGISSGIAKHVREVSTELAYNNSLRSMTPMANLQAFEASRSSPPGLFRQTLGGLLGGAAGLAAVAGGEPEQTKMRRSKMNKHAGWKDTALSTLIGGGAGGALGAGYGALEGDGNIGLRALEGAGIGGMAGLGSGLGKTLAQKLDEARLAKGLEAQFAGNISDIGLKKRLRLAGDKLPTGFSKGLASDIAAVSPRSATGARIGGGVAGAAAGAGGVAAAESGSKKHSKKAAYEAGVVFALSQYGLEKVAAYLF